VPNSSSVLPWALTMPAGSLQQWQFSFTTLAAAGPTQPYPVTGATWEYVARPTATDLSVPPLISLTTAETASGVLVVTATATVSQVLLQIYPPATAGLNGEYFHALWMWPGNGTSAFTWVTGPLIVQGNPQP
jgi:hypothetical protein